MKKYIKEFDLFFKFRLMTLVMHRYVTEFIWEKNKNLVFKYFDSIIHFENKIRVTDFVKKICVKNYKKNFQV